MTRTLPRWSRIAVVLLLAATAAATVVVHADARRLSRLADLVVDGQVTKRAVVVEPGSGALWTTYEVDVTETWLGAARDDVVVHVPGGEAGGLSQEVSGTARLRVGKRTVLFLTLEDGRYLVLGQAQGCFRVERGDDGETLVCRNDIEGLALVDDSGRPVEGRATELRHEELRRRVRAVAQEREEAERRRRAARARKLAELRESAERNAERTRGKPGGAE